MKTIPAIFLFSVCLYGQTSDGDDPVTVPKKYVSAEGMSHQIQNKEVSQWMGIGKEIGIATKEGLESVVDVSQKFSNTNVGHFVMFMIAWKIIGHQALAIVLGIPIWLAGCFLWVWALRRFMLGSRMLKTYDETTKTKTFETVKYEFKTGEGRMGAGIVFIITIIIWCVMWTVEIFG